VQLNEVRIPLQRRRWLYLIVAAVLVSIPVLVIVVFTASEVKRAVRGQPQLPGSTWPWIVVSDTMMLGMIVAVVHEARTTLSLYFSERGIHEGRRFIAWPEVTRVEMNPARITIRSTRTKIIVNLWTFKNPDEVRALVRSHAPWGTEV
jgi:hypothetical protein